MARFIQISAMLLAVGIVGSAHAFKLAASMLVAPGTTAVGPLKGSGPKFLIGGPAGAVAFEPNGRVLWSVNVISHELPDPPTMEMAGFDLVTRTEIARFDVGQGGGGVPVIMPSGTKAYVPIHYAVAVVDLVTHAVTTIPLPPMPNGAPVGTNGGVSLDRAGTHLVVSGGGTFDSVPYGRISVIDTSTDTIVDSVDLEEFPGNVAIAPAGDRLYVVMYQPVRSIAAFDVATLTENGRYAVDLPAGSSWGALAVHSSGEQLYATWGTSGPPASGGIFVINTSTMTGRTSITNVQAGQLVSDPRGKTLWATTANGVATYKIGCDVRTKRPIPVDGVLGIAAKPCPTCRRFSSPCRQ